VQNVQKESGKSYWLNKIQSDTFFSIVPYLRQNGTVTIFENSIQSNFGFQPTCQSEPPIREENDIHGFSRKSRTRMFNLFTRINYSDYGFPVFSSNTWQHDFPDTRITIKNFLKNYYEGLKSKLPSHKIVWKLEYQKRGAPHYHLMLLPEDSSIDFRNAKYSNIISDEWFKRKKCKCDDCKKYSVKVKAINDFKHAMIYISKELAKVGENYQEHDLGRIWGASRSLKCNPLYTVKTDYKTFRELLSKILEKKILQHGGEIQLLAMKDFCLDSQLWISYEDIKFELIKFLQDSRDKNRLQHSRHYQGMVMKKYNFKQE
jgi:hypothetical protein